MQMQMQMDNSSDLFYRHSGQFGPVGILLMSGLGVVGGIVLGAVYGALIYWIPFIYANFLGTLCVGFAAGAAVYLGAVMGRVRNPMLCGLIGVIAGCAAIWGAWVAWIYVLSSDGGTGAILLDMGVLWETMMVVGEEGVWGIGRNSSSPVRGFWLYLVWIIEAVVILGVAGLTAGALLSGKAFCERCSCWLKNETKLPRLSPPPDEHALDGLADGDVSGILVLGHGPKEGVCIEVKLQGCRTCDEIYLADVSLVVESLDKKGKTETNTTSLVTNLRLSASDYRALCEFKGLDAAPAVVPV
ncbi:MAG: hypothetical protein GY794_19040 [bacterium]|nr:hypothetical protein [bacterium]